jgi:hypothetical protein
MFPKNSAFQRLTKIRLYIVAIQSLPLKSRLIFKLIMIASLLAAILDHLTEENDMYPM